MFAIFGWHQKCISVLFWSLGRFLHFLVLSLAYNSKRVHFPKIPINKWSRWYYCMQTDACLKLYTDGYIHGRNISTIFLPCLRLRYANSSTLHFYSNLQFRLYGYIIAASNLSGASWNTDSEYYFPSEKFFNIQFLLSNRI